MQIPLIGDVNALALVVSSGIAAVLLANFFLSKSSADPPRKPKIIAEGKTEFTLAEVALFDGKGPEGEPILTIIDELVYDLQKGREFYGEGGPYHSFVGRDCSRLLAKNQISDASDTGLELTDTEKDQLEKWKEFFQGKYGSIGKVVK